MTDGRGSHAQSLASDQAVTTQQQRGEQRRLKARTLRWRSLDAAAAAAGATWRYDAQRRPTAARAALTCFFASDMLLVYDLLQPVFDSRPNTCGVATQSGWSLGSGVDRR